MISLKNTGKTVLCMENSSVIEQKKDLFYDSIISASRKMGRNLIRTNEKGAS